MPVASMGSLDTGQQADQRLSKLASWHPEPLMGGLILSGPNTPHEGSNLPIATLLRMLHSHSPHDVTGALSYISRTLHLGRGSFTNEVCTAGVVSSVMQHTRSTCDTNTRLPAFLVLNSIAKCGKTAGRSALAVAGAVDVALSALTEVFDLEPSIGLTDRSSARSLLTPVPNSCTSRGSTPRRSTPRSSTPRRSTPRSSTARLPLAPSSQRATPRGSRTGQTHDSTQAAVAESTCSTHESAMHESACMVPHESAMHESGTQELAFYESTLEEVQQSSNECTSDTACRSLPDATQHSKGPAMDANGMQSRQGTEVLFLEADVAAVLKSLIVMVANTSASSDGDAYTAARSKERSHSEHTEPTAEDIQHSHSEQRHTSTGMTQHSRSEQTHTTSCGSLVTVKNSEVTGVSMDETEELMVVSRAAGVNVDLENTPSTACRGGESMEPDSQGCEREGARCRLNKSVDLEIKLSTACSGGEGMEPDSQGSDGKGVPCSLNTEVDADTAPSTACEGGVTWDSQQRAGMRDSSSSDSLMGFASESPVCSSWVAADRSTMAVIVAEHAGEENSSLHFISEAAGIAPEAAVTAPEVADIAPAVVDSAPESADIAPEATDIAPAVADFAPEEAGVAPAVADIAPEATDIVPAVAHVAPEATDIILAVADIAPGTVDIAPAVADIAPEATDIVPAVADIASEAADIGLEAVRLLGWMTVDASTVHRVCSPAAIHYLVAVLRYEQILHVRPQVIKEAAAAVRRISRNALVAARVVSEHGVLAALPYSLMSDNEYVRNESVRLLDQLCLHLGVRHKIEAMLGMPISAYTTMLMDAKPASRKLLVQKLQGQLPHHVVGTPLSLDEAIGGDFEDLHALRVSTALALASACDLRTFGSGPLSVSLSVRTDELSTMSEPGGLTTATPCQQKAHRGHLCDMANAEQCGVCTRELQPMDAWLTMHPSSPLLSSATVNSHITSVTSLPSPLWSATTPADQRLSRSASSTNSPTALYMYPCYTSRSLPTPRGPPLQSLQISVASLPTYDMPEQVTPHLPTATTPPISARASNDSPTPPSCSLAGDASTARCSSTRLPVLQEVEPGKLTPTDTSASEPSSTITRHDIPPLPKLSCRTVLPAASVYEAKYNSGSLADNASVVTSEPSSAVQSARGIASEAVTEDKPAGDAVDKRITRTASVGSQTDNTVELSTLTIGALRKELSLSTATARFSERTAARSSNRSRCGRNSRDGSVVCAPVRVSRSAGAHTVSTLVQPDLVPWPADPGAWFLGLGCAADTRQNSGSSHSSWHSPPAVNKGVSVSMNWLADSFSAASRNSSPLTHHRQSALLSSINFQGSIHAHSPCQAGSVLPPVQSFCALSHLTATGEDLNTHHPQRGGLLFSSQLIALGTEGESATLYSTFRSSGEHPAIHPTPLPHCPDSFRLPPRIKTTTWHPTPPPSPKVSEASPVPQRRFTQLHVRLSSLCAPRLWCGDQQPSSAATSNNEAESDSEAVSVVDEDDLDACEEESELGSRASSAVQSTRGKEDGSQGVKESGFGGKALLLVKLRVKSASARSLASVRSSPTKVLSESGSATRRAAWKRFLKRQQLHLVRMKSRKVDSGAPTAVPA